MKNRVFFLVPKVISWEENSSSIIIHEKPRTFFFPQHLTNVPLATAWLAVAQALPASSLSDGHPVPTHGGPITLLASHITTHYPAIAQDPFVALGSPQELFPKCRPEMLLELWVGPWKKENKGSPSRISLENVGVNNLNRRLRSEIALNQYLRCMWPQNPLTFWDIIYRTLWFMSHLPGFLSGDGERSSQGDWVCPRSAVLGQRVPVCGIPFIWLAFP